MCLCGVRFSSPLGSGGWIWERSYFLRERERERERERDVLVDGILVKG